MRGALLKRSPAGGRFLYSVAKFVLHCPHRRRWQSSQGIKAVLDISRRSALVLGSTTPLAYSSLSSGTAIEAMSTESLKDAVKDIVPTLSGDLAKGQAGKIGVIGGCREYTGAPYFAAISALKIGADLSHVFCTEGAATVIKSYSPELIVHPYLPDSHDPTSLSDEDRVNEAVGAIDHWMERFDAIVIGPGLGRDTLVHETVKKVLVKLKEKRKPVVIDADGLYITTKNLNLIKGYDLAVLTPNKNEFQRLANELNVSLDNQSGQSDENILKDITSQLGGPLLLRKGTADQVCDGQEVWNNSEAGSKRRAGGQGDVLSGCLAVMISWALSKQQQKDDMQQIKKDLVIAAFGGSLVARHAQKAAFEKCGRSMLAQDVIDQLGATVDRLFDV